MNKNKVEGFIGNESLIKESHKMDDLFDVKEQKQSFEKFLDTLDNSAIAGYLGRFGAGKSTLLHQIKKEREKKQEEVWIDFDAWKFPERKELWDGFVLDFAKQIDKKLFNKVKKQIEGNDNRGKKAIFNTFSDLSGIKFLKNFESFFDKTPATRIFEIQDIINEAIEKLDKDIYIVAEDIDRSGKEGLFFLETLSQFLRD
jgi:predicted KAP-like P-loop ATPase